MNLRNIQFPVGQGVTPQGRGIGALAQQIKLIDNGALKFLDHLERAQAFAVGTESQQAGQQLHHAQIFADGALDAGPNHLNDHFLAIKQ